jgi:hypothetical protein
MQGCGSGSGFSGFVDPDTGSGSRGKKLINFSGKMHFLVICLKKILPLKRYKIAPTTF